MNYKSSHKINVTSNYAADELTWTSSNEKVATVDENGNEDFQSILKEIRRKDHTIENPCYQIFDFITEDEFNLKTVSPKFDYRYSRMVRMARGCQYPTLKVLKQELLLTQDDFDRWERYVAEGHWEGFMLRKNEEFKKDRIKTLLKVKKFLDAEYVVNDVEVAELTAAEPGVGNIKYMGVKSLNKYLNKYEAADEFSKDICKRLINLEEKLAVDIRDYL